MKNDRLIDLGLTGYEELFMSTEERLDAKKPKVEAIPLAALTPFRNHPFQVKEDKEMAQLMRSIADAGVLSPALARPLPDGGYELISGHRRLAACKALGMDTMPVIIRDLTDEEAVITMVDSNLQREHILPSEKAFAYKMKYEAMKHQGTSCQLGTKLCTDEQIAEKANDSARQIQRYIRLTHLIPELLEFMDENRMALSVGVELSFLDEQSQRNVLEQCEMNDCTPSYSQAWRMHKADREGTLTKAAIQTIMSEEKANQRETVKIPTEKLRKFAPNANPQQLEDFVLKACEHYRKYLRRQRDAR